MFKTCAVLLICLAVFVAGQNWKRSAHTSKGSGHTSKGSGHTSKGSGHTSKGSGHTSKGSGHTSKGSGHSSSGHGGTTAFCNPNKCQNGAICDDKKDVCRCRRGYYGTYCEMSFCNPNKCQNGATCDDKKDVCICPRGYFWTYCEMSVCDKKPCQNGGSCQIDPFKCNCTADFYGDHCEYQYNPCANGTDALCGNGVCVDGIGEGEFDCIEHDHCIPSPCKNGGTCVCNGDSDVTCICPPGYTGPFCASCDDNGSSGGTGCSGGKGKVAVSVNVDVC